MALIVANCSFKLYLDLNWGGLVCRNLHLTFLMIFIQP